MYTDFTEGRIVRPLLAFAIPVLFSLFLQNLYGAVDLLIVGQFGNASDVSAVSTGSLLMQTVTFLITGLSTGVSIICGHRIGEKKMDEVGKLIGSSLVFFLLVSLALTSIMFLFAPAAVTWMKAPPEAFDKTLAYVRICSIGMISISGYNLIGSIFRGIGDSKMPLVAVSIASFFNILGDLVLVGYFSMGPEGAAIATIMAQTLSVLFSLLILKKRHLPFSVGRKDIRLDIGITKKVLSLGCPTAIQDVLVTLSFLFIISIGNSLGVVASAGVGIAEKVCGLVMLIPCAYNQSIAAFVSQNDGAGRLDRAKKALVVSILISFITGAMIFYAAFFHGDILSAVFSSDKAVIAASADYLRAYAIDCLLVSFYFCFLGYLIGRGRTFFVMLVGIIGSFCVRVPLSYLFSKIEGITLFGIGLSIPISTIIQITLVVIYFTSLLKKDKQTAR